MLDVGLGLVASAGADLRGMITTTIVRTTRHGIGGVPLGTLQCECARVAEPVACKRQNNCLHTLIILAGLAVVIDINAVISSKQHRQSKV